MAILENEVYVILSNKIIKHYENLGYEIPKYKDNHRRYSVKRGTEILVKVNDLPKSSNVKLTKICDFCGKHSEMQPYASILKYRQKGDGFDRCSECAVEKIKISKINKFTYENSLAHYAITNNKRYLLEEFSDKNEKKPSEIYKSNGTLYLWTCKACNSEYYANTNSRTRGYGCPYCAGRKVNTTNCLAILNPTLAKEWHPSLNENLSPFDVTLGSHKRAWWMCSKDITHVWKTSVHNRSSNKGCPICSEYKGEKRIRKWLEENSVKFKHQKEFEGLIGTGGGLLSYDFYLPRLNILIEYQGEFHDGNGNYYMKENLEKQQEHDKRKRDYANLHNIKLLEIWYWNYEKVEEILEKEIFS